MVSAVAGCAASSPSPETPQTPSPSNDVSAVPKEAAASSEQTDAPAEQTAAPAEPTNAPAAQETAQTGDANKKALVVYYSATGNTKAVAQTISETLSADMFEIVPVSPYTDDDLNWNNEDSRVAREHENPELRDVELVSTTVENWDSYDTVYIGYPIWWAVAAWPVDNFVKSNDFTGKTVIPFCTTTSSGIGQSGELLAALTGTGDWQEGERFASGASADDVKAWVDGIA